MSRVTVRPLAGEGRFSQSVARVGPTLISMSADAITELLQRMVGVVAPALAALPAQLPKLQTFPKDACCSIPETECPPRCVCEISWEATCGEKLGCTIRVRNSSGHPRSFAITATPFIGVGAPASSIAVSPQELSLQPGAAGLVEAVYTVPEEAKEGTYEAEILVRGAYEQCVRVLLRVMSRQACPQGEPHCVCEVVQGDPPVRIRAHHWYDHFQCTEPCFHARPERPGQIVDGDPNTIAGVPS